MARCLWQAQGARRGGTHRGSCGGGGGPWDRSLRCPGLNSRCCPERRRLGSATQNELRLQQPKAGGEPRLRGGGLCVRRAPWGPSGPATDRTPALQSQAPEGQGFMPASEPDRLRQPLARGQLWLVPESRVLAGSGHPPHAPGPSETAGLKRAWWQRRGCPALSAFPQGGVG